jgi:hypothetical protein
LWQNGLGAVRQGRFLDVFAATIARDIDLSRRTEARYTALHHETEAEEFMRLNVVATTVAVIAAAGLLALPAGAAPKKKVAVIDTRGHTVFTSRDEDGKTRTRIIIQKRSYLDPGTETFPGENTGGGYAQLPTQHATSVLDNTVTGNSQSPLPGPFTLPGKNNPWIGN